VKDLAELEKQYKRLGEEIQRLKEESTEPKLGQKYWTITFQDGWAAYPATWDNDHIDRRRLKSGICFWRGTEEENEAAARRAILRCRYALEGQWKPKQDQAVSWWESDGTIWEERMDWTNRGKVFCLNYGEYSPTREEAEARRDEFTDAFLWGLEK